MKTSQHGLAFLASEEGEVDHVYKDQVGVPTIGVGHVVRPGESFPDGITHDQAMALLEQDVGTAESAIDAHVTEQLTQNAFDACVSFTFNLGTGAFTGSTLLRLINQGDMQGAAAEFPKWCHAPAGVVNQGILSRRKREAALFLTPDDAPKDVPPPPASVPTGFAATFFEAFDASVHS